MNLLSHLLATFFMSLLTVLPGQAEPAITVFAAASLRDAFEAVVADYSGDVVVSYGGSGQVARHVTQGAPADIILLANVEWMDWLEKREAIAPGSRRNLLGNSLVLVGSAGSKKLSDLTADKLSELLAGGRLAIAHTNGVPAGIYGRQWMEAAGFWQMLKPQLAETENVRAALALVSRGEAPLGVVYLTDAMADPQVDVVYRIDPSMHASITYPIAVVRDRSEPHIIDFMDFILSPAQLETFRSHGFAVIGG